MKDYGQIINDPARSAAERLEALQALEAAGGPGKTAKTGEINNHIHTIYSFSPYTPAMAALKARNAGLEAAGSVDHDSAGAAEEMLAACGILGIGGCAGFEVRVSFKDGPFAGKKLNNPDSEGIAYMTVQGIPRQSLKKAADFLAPIRAERLKRTVSMAENANALLREAGLGEIDFDRDIRGKSCYDAGGEITERHLLAAVAGKLIAKYGRGPALARGLDSAFGADPGPKIAALLADPDNPHCLFDLLGVLKSALLPRIFIQGGEAECVPAREMTEFALSIGAVPAYAYLGDVGESPTGDKKAEKFEDDFLEPLFDELKAMGYRAVTYMPPRNTAGQLSRVRRLCRERGFMEISGVDINSSRQSFNCPRVLEPAFRHLVGTTWALIAHERLATADPRLALFSPENPFSAEPLEKRLEIYAEKGKMLDPYRSDESAFAMAKEIL
ncbi:MAG: PHP domain-containing protein [Treponema sp.]|nr:PHP domain-containing protein [Treponema sp.]